ncbi:putative phospholipid hydroperoxide glutathione peroxidase [Vespula squamosa]|uniref:Glutathione peroxidase n=1 Tax=Vespula squamosa TaxID=30214 RepID=A0ABD2AD08_VESSQ
MLRIQISLLLICFLSAVLSEKCEDNNKKLCTSNNDEQQSLKSATSIYDFHALDIHGNDVNLNKYRGHVLIIVNVASNCGLTDTNYKQLVQLYEKYGNSAGLRILAFPSNQFGGQEPGTSQEILNFVKKYNVTFDMFNKVDVNGNNAHPLWKWLTELSGDKGGTIKWNFTKFIVDKEGNVVARFAPNNEPLEMEPILKEYL